jgi:hypothetical protein
LEAQPGMSQIGRKKSDGQWAHHDNTNVLFAGNTFLRMEIQYITIHHSVPIMHEGLDYRWH